MDGAPTVIVEDRLGAARETRGLARMDQIEFAVAEANGRISIILR